MWGKQELRQEAVKLQYKQVNWNEAEGLSPEALEEGILALEKELVAQNTPLPLVKAKCFAYLMEHSAVAAEPCCFLQDHIRHGNHLQKRRWHWQQAVAQNELKEEVLEETRARECSSYSGVSDFGHTAPDWVALMQLGIPGILARLENARAEKRTAGTITEAQEVFYAASILVYESVKCYLKRLANECLRVAPEQVNPDDAQRLRFCAESLQNLCERAPKTLQEALQLGYVYHILQEEIEGERLRSFGAIDQLYRPFYENDLASGAFTPEMEYELLQDMMLKFYALTEDWLFGEPMYIGGTLPDGSDAVCDFTYVIIDAFDSLNIANPKFHARFSKNSPQEYVERVCDCIRRGNSSFVFLSDDAGIPMMQKVGATLEEARDYVPIGCYEPCIAGKEVGCTGNGLINFAKAMELVLHNGTDPLTGTEVGVKTGPLSAFATFEKLKDAIDQQVCFMTDRAAHLVCRWEEYYNRINPSPLFSATMEECVRRGVDAFEGGAVYNNSSINAVGQGTLADSLVQVKKLVYDTKQLTLEQFSEILDRNWEGEELLRAKIRNDKEKWGNGCELPDSLAAEYTKKFADRLNAMPNARGGRFKAGIISINHNYAHGKKMGATPDGRSAGEPINKNLGASVAMDRSGVTAHIKSVCRIDHTDLPNGSVLDLVLHPSAVSGAEGLKAFAGIIRTYAAMGGFAVHVNIFDANVLRAAQADPEKYRNLQVRVCGWNQYFINLSRAEQDDFIRQSMR